MTRKEMMSDLMSRLQDVKNAEYREPELILWLNQAYVWLVRRVAPIDRKDLLVSAAVTFAAGIGSLPANFGVEQSFIIDGVIRARKIEPSDIAHVTRSSLYVPSYTASDPKSLVYYYIENAKINVLPASYAGAGNLLHYFILPAYMTTDDGATGIPIVREFYHDIIVTKAEATARRRKNITGWENVDALAEKELKSVIDTYAVETEIDKARGSILQ